MTLTMIDDFESGDRVFTLRIRSRELVAIELQPFDRLLLADCDRSDKVSDKLLALETVARRIEEAS